MLLHIYETLQSTIKGVAYSPSLVIHSGYIAIACRNLPPPERKRPKNPAGGQSGNIWLEAWSVTLRTASCHPDRAALDCNSDKPLSAMSGFLNALVNADDSCGPVNPLAQLSKGLQGEGSQIGRVRRAQYGPVL